MIDQLSSSAPALLVAAGVGVSVLAVGSWVVSLRRVVETNMVHIVQSAKKTVSYGKDRENGNTYYQWPSWIPIVGVVVSSFPESIFEIGLIDYEAYDADRLPFMVDIRAFFRIENSNSAAQRVSSFEELREQLRAVLQGSVRRVLATSHLETIMQDRSELGDKFTQEVREQLTEWGVAPVKTIEFMDIRDSRQSNVIQNIMAKKISEIDKESRIKVAENRREAETKEIEAQRAVEVQRQDAERQVGEKTAEKEKAVGIADERARQEIAAESKVTAERDMEVKQVQDVRAAEIAKDVAIVNAEKDKGVAIVAAEAAKEQTIIAANASREQTVIAAEAKKKETATIAEGERDAALRDAEGIQARGAAEAEALKLKELAPIQAQITLAQEIGENPGYQSYLISVRQIEAAQDVGTHMAAAIGKADLKVITNAGDPQSGVAKIGDLFSTGGGHGLTGMLTALSQTPEGEALVRRFTGAEQADTKKKGGKGSTTSV